MATIKKFEDLEVWQLAREVCTDVYKLTLKNSFSKDFELKDQINASSGSVMDNIAEGFDRDGSKEFRQFLSISKGSCGELKSQSYRALDRGHITLEEQKNLSEKAETLRIKIGNFITYLNNSDIKGRKYKQN